MARFLVAALGDLRPGVVEQITTLAAVCPNSLTTAKGKSTAFGVVFVRVNTAALAGLQIEAGEDEVLAWVISVQAPVADIDRRAAVVGDDDIFVALYL